MSETSETSETVSLISILSHSKKDGVRQGLFIVLSHSILLTHLSHSMRRPVLSHSFCLTHFYLEQNANMKITLPMPPPTNRLWLPKLPGVAMQPEGRDYARTVAGIIRAAGVKPITGPVSLAVTTHVPHITASRLADIGHALAILLAADHVRPTPLPVPIYAAEQLVSLTLRRGPVQAMPCVEVEVEQAVIANQVAGGNAGQSSFSFSQSEVTQKT